MGSKDPNSSCSASAEGDISDTYLAASLAPRLYFGRHFETLGFRRTYNIASTFSLLAEGPVRTLAAGDEHSVNHLKGKGN